MINSLSYEDFRDKGRRFSAEMTLLDDDEYRPLSGDEIEILQARGSSAGDWSDIMVKEGFDAAKVSACRFYGQVRIGRLDDIALQTETLALPVGLYESTLTNSRIGDNCALYRVSYLSGYLVGEGSLLKNIDELSLSSSPSFGEMKLDDAQESAIEAVNENGNRSIQPFLGIWSADAHLWAKERGRPELLRAFETFSRERAASSRGCPFGKIGGGSFVQGLSIGRDLILGEAARIEGAVRIVDCSIQSSEQRPSIIGGGVDLQHGIVGYGCRVESGAKAEHFILADYSTVEMGARLSHSYLGENSTVARCEVANSLMLPFHEQHHNSSFLIAAMLEGQSNIASGATIGSNHSSRRADGELFCRRGFWPALTSSLKYPSSFASFSLLAKEDYPHEIHNPLPFSLLSRDQDTGALVVLPAFWLIYNRYALERNGRKYKNRDARISAGASADYLPPEYEPLAADTAEEIADTLELLSRWTYEAWIEQNGSEGIPQEIAEEREGEKSKERAGRIGDYLLGTKPQEASQIEILRSDIERSRLATRILKLPKAYAAYRGAVLLYAVKILLTAAEERGGEIPPFTEFVEGWVNIGGSLFRRDDREELLEAVEEGRIVSWDELHLRYRELHSKYHHDKINHAYTLLLRIGELQAEELDAGTVPWRRLAEEAIAEQRRLFDAVRASREKDFTDPLRAATFSSSEEMRAVLGSFEEDGLIEEVEEDTKGWIARLEKLKER